TLVGLWTLDLGRWTNVIDPPARFRFFRSAGVENNAVAALQWSSDPRDHAVAQHALDFADEYAALFAETRVDELLVVDAAEPAGVKPVRKRHFHRVTIRRRRW